MTKCKNICFNILAACSMRVSRGTREEGGGEKGKNKQKKRELLLKAE